MRGVSDNIMLGQLAPIGTAAFTLCVDEDMLERLGPEDTVAVEDPVQAARDITPHMPSDVQASTPFLQFSAPTSPEYTAGSPVYSPVSPAYSLSGEAAGSDGYVYSPGSPQYGDTTDYATSAPYEALSSPDFSYRSPSPEYTVPTYGGDDEADEA